MQKLHTYVFDKILTSVILPIVIVELLLIIFISILSYNQARNHQELMLERANESFESLTMQIAVRMEQEFNSVKKDTTALKNIVEASFENEYFHANSKLNFSYDDGFYIADDLLKASIYTTNITSLKPIDRESLELLYLAISPIDALMKEHGEKIDTTWINFGRKYSLFYPKIRVKYELSPDLDVTKEAYYFKADKKHNPDKKTIFIPLFDETWALELGQIGAIVAPIYKNEEMYGVVGLTLTTENTQKLSEIDLPFEAYVMITNRNGYILFSSNEAQSRNDFNVSSFTGLYKEKKREPLKMFQGLDSKNTDYLFHKHELSDIPLDLILVAKKSEVNKDLIALFKQTRNIGIFALLLIVFLHLYMYRKLRSRTVAMTADISRPVIKIANASKKLFQEESLKIEKSNIKEITVLHENLEKAHHKLINQLYVDAVTGLSNQRKLLLDIQKDDSLILISVDNLKNISNIYGPDMGDDVLSILVLNLQKIYTDEARLYRVSNDTFALLLPKLSVLNDIDLKAHYEKIKIIEVIKDNISVSLHFSLSLAKKPSSDFSLFACADIALNEARKQEHLSYVTFDNTKHLKDYKENLKWAKKLQDAFDNEQLIAYFQPIYDVKEKKVRKFESLVRMMDDGKVISPFYFLGAAAQMGKLSDITRFMLKEVFTVAQRYKDVEFSINIAFEDFEQANLLSDIKKLLKEYDVQADNIIFELLETGTLHDEQKVVEAISELKSLGCKIAIDDFGAGNSNFAYLMLMKVDYLKIDGQFVKNINADEQSHNITKTIKTFADMTGAKTIAEYVFEKEVFETIEALEIDYAQGYYVSEPKPASDIDEMLAISKIER